MMSKRRRNECFISARAVKVLRYRFQSQAGMIDSQGRHLAKMGDVNSYLNT